MANAGFKQGGNLGGSFLGILGTGIVTVKAFAWNSAIGAGKAIDGTAMMVVQVDPDLEY